MPDDKQKPIDIWHGSAILWPELEEADLTWREFENPHTIAMEAE